MGQRVGSARAALRRFVARQPDPYVGASMDNARRLGGALWLTTALVVVALLPLAPPDESLGDAGWALAGTIVALWLAGAVLLLTLRTHLGFQHLLLGSYVALVAIATLDWLAGDQLAPYHQLFLVAFLYTAVIHPPRQVLLYLALAAPLVAAPLAYGDWTGARAGQVGVELLIWSGIALVGVVLMSRVRAQRVALRLEREQASRLARVDPLTGLGNRRAFDEAVAREVARAKRIGGPLTLALIDLDDFKAINDAHGHLRGDQCLREAAASLEGSVRRPDSCFRWGGDEFCVLLPHVDSGEAAAICERVKAEIEGRCRRPDGTPLRIKYGYAELTDESDGDQLLAKADAAVSMVEGGR